MAYKLDLGVKTVHGTNPQNLIEHIVRERIFASTYWKEECFGLNAAALVKRAMNLTYVGGTWGGHRRPTPFLCLLLKMLMIQPEMDIVEAFISEKDFRYVRLLGAFYLRLVGTGVEVYKCLETLYSDNRKFKFRQLDGTFTVDYIDNFVDSLLSTVRVCDTTLPPLVNRKVLMDRGKLTSRSSLLDDMLIDEQSDDEENDTPTTSRRLSESSDQDIPTSSTSNRSHSHSLSGPSTYEDERGRKQIRATNSSHSSPSHSPLRSLSAKRSGFRSPSPNHGDHKGDTHRNDETTHSTARTSSPPSRTASSPERRSSLTNTRASARSPDINPSERQRGQRSPDSSPLRSNRGNRSPDAPPSTRRAERSPDVRDSRDRRGARSPNRRDSRNDSPRHTRDDYSPDYHQRRRKDDSPDHYRRRSPDRRETDRERGDSRRYDSRDDRRGSDRQRDRYDDYDDRYNSKKRERQYGDRGDDDDERSGRFHGSKRPKYDEGRPKSSTASSRAGGSGGDGKKGGLRDMSVDQMNELRKSIGLGPLRS